MPAPEPPAPEGERARMVCAGCGAALPADEPLPFRCPAARAGDDVDHVLRPALPRAPAELPEDGDPHAFVRYRELSFGYHFAREHGLSDADHAGLVAELDRAVAEVDGHGMAPTRFAPEAALGKALGFGASGGLWVADETGQVAGSHKARHLFGIMLHLLAVQRLGLLPGGAPPPLAIASCGNAALAAAVVAVAARWPLEVFVPPDAEPAVVRRLLELRARVVTCARAEGERGDPCVARFHRALDGGAAPFGCQGNDNGLCIEGGQTLAYEIVRALRQRDGELDALLVQVGGGALFSACYQGLERARELGWLARMPRLYAVQTAGAAPLARAYERLAGRIARQLGIGERDPAARARAIAERAAAPEVEAELRRAAARRSQFMWPWEQEPRSVARGILDDETYDWHAVVTGLLRTGGRPVTADEETLRAAHRLARAETGVAVCPTGTAGLAGVLCLEREGEWEPDENVGVLFTGRER